LATEAGCPIRHEGDTAYYNPSLNEIVLPTPDHFKSLREYYWEAFTQISHAIAGRHQMDLWQPQDGVDFSKNMELKRLYAQMAAAMFAYESGIDVL
jgi:antirestriction protein ArdC